MTKSYENIKSSTNSKRPESISNILSSAFKNPVCTVDDPPVCPTTQKWHLWSFSCHQNHVVTLYCFFVQYLFKVHLVSHSVGDDILEAIGAPHRQHQIFGFVM